MTVRQLCVSGAALALLVAVPAAVNAQDTGSHSLRRESGRQCIVGHYHGGAGEGGTKGVAMVMAIKTFVDTTEAEYGAAWAKWAKAADKDIKYTKTGDVWSVAIKGRPCR